MFGIIILLLGSFVVVTTYKDVTPFWFDGTQAERIQTLWQQDMELLVRNRSLPKEWIQTAEIKYFPLTDSVKELLTKIKPPLAAHEDGGFRMEVTIDDWKDGTDYGLMIQYQIFDTASDNLIWELGRTLIVADSKVIEKSGDKIKTKPEKQKPSNDKTK